MPAKHEAKLQAIREQLRKIAESPAGDAKLERVKRYLTGLLGPRRPK